MTIRMTFSLDEDSVERLHRAAERLGRPKSQVVREAIRDYSERLGRLSEGERRRLLAAFDELVPAIPERPEHEVDEELAEIRTARRQGGRHGGPEA